MRGLTWPAKRGHVAHAHVGGNNEDKMESLNDKKSTNVTTDRSTLFKMICVWRFGREFACQFGERNWESLSILYIRFRSGFLKLKVFS